MPSQLHDRRRSLATIALTALALLALGAGSVQADPSARIACKATDNAKPASGSLLVEAAGKIVARGACSSEGVQVPAGVYTAIIALDGALDAPEQRKRVEVAAGAVGNVTADFATGVLQVAIQRAGKPAAGMVIVRKGNRQIGTLASGVRAHLSAGTYELSARYRSQEKVLGAVRIARGEQKTIRVEFD